MCTYAMCRCCHNCRPKNTEKILCLRNFLQFQNVLLFFFLIKKKNLIHASSSHTNKKKISKTKIHSLISFDLNVSLHFIYLFCFKFNYNYHINLTNDEPFKHCTKFNLTNCDFEDRTLVRAKYVDILNYRP